MRSVAPDESASGGTTSVSVPALALGQLRASAPGWLSVLTDTGRGREAHLPCLSQSAIGETESSTVQQLADRGTVTMGGEQDATYALDSVEEALTTCSSTRTWVNDTVVSTETTPEP